MTNAMGDEGEHEAGGTRLASALAALEAHPATLVHSCVDELVRDLDGVLLPNHQELVAVLDAAATSPPLAFELVQNVHAPTVRVAFERLLSRRLLNYLASSIGLVEHVRRILRRLPAELTCEFKERTSELLANPEIQFMQDLRNYTLHYALPFVGHTLTFSALNTPEQSWRSDVELSVSDLRRWKDWRGGRKFLDTQGDTIALLPLVRRHGTLMRQHNQWLVSRMIDFVNTNVDELNELREAVECARWGITREEARASMVERSKRDRTPVPEEVMRSLADSLRPGDWPGSS